MMVFNSVAKLIHERGKFAENLSENTKQVGQYRQLNFHVQILRKTKQSWIHKWPISSLLW